MCMPFFLSLGRSIKLTSCYVIAFIPLASAQSHSRKGFICVRKSVEYINVHTVISLSGVLSYL